MKIFKWIKRLVVIGSLLMGMVLLGYWGAMQWIDFNRFKPQLQQLAAQKGVYLQMDHTTLEAAAFPFILQAKNLAGRLDGRYLSDSIQKSEFKIRELDIKLSLWALFIERKIRITNMQVSQPQWTLTLAQGHEAWVMQQLNAHSSASQNLAASSVIQLGHFYQTSATAQPVQKVTSAKSDIEWRLKSLFVEGGRLRLQTADRQKVNELYQLQLMAFGIRSQQPFPLSLQFKFNRWLPKEQANLTGSVAISAQGQYQWSKQLWQLMQLHGTALVQLPEKLRVPPLKLQLDAQQVQYRGQMQQLQMSGLSLKGLGSEVGLDVTADLDKKQWQGSVVLSEVNLKSWARHINFQLPDFTHKEALTQLSGAFRWQWQPQNWQVNDLDLNWDGSQIQGRMWQQQLSSGAPIELNFDLKVDQINLDHYQARMASISTEQKTKKSAKTPSPATLKSIDTVYLPFAVPVSTLRALQAEGHLQVGELVVKGAHLQKLDATLEASKGKLAFAPFDFDLYGGQWRSKLILNVQGKTPAYRMKGRLEQVQLAPLWQDLKVPATLTGIGSSRFYLHTQGSNLNAWLGHMTGALRLAVEKGRIQGGDLNQMLQGLVPNSKQATYFQQLLLDGKVQQGIYKIKQARLLAPRFKAQGFGQVNWVTQAVDLTLKARLVNPKDASLAQAVVPFKIEGTLQKPVWQVEVSKLLNSPENKQVILQKLGQLLQKL